MKARDFYNNVSDVYEEWLLRPECKVEFHNKAKEIFDKHKIGEGSILDLGCGPGNLKTLLGESFEYTGIDIAEKMLEKAKKKGYTTLQGTINEILPTIKDKSFDYIVSLSTLHFVEDINPLIQHFNRVARKGWLITLEEITESYKKNLQVSQQMYNHSHVVIADLTEDIFFPGWVSPTTGDAINVRMVFKKF